MVGGQEFDVAELSASEFISLNGSGDCPFVALPVFPSRVFRHGYVFVNTRAASARRRTSRASASAFRSTPRPPPSGCAATWRISSASISIPSDGSRARWRRPARTAARAAAAPAASHREGGSDGRYALLARGAIDALIGSRKPGEFGRDPDVARLFPTTVRSERGLYEQTGIFPIMHLIAIRRELYERQRWIARSLYDAFEEVKRRALARMCYAGSLAAMLPWLIDEMEEIDKVRRRRVSLRHRGQPADLAGAGRVHGGTALHRAADPDRGPVRAAPPAPPRA